MKTLFITLCLMLVMTGTRQLSAQPCPDQDPFQCTGNEKEYFYTICFGGLNYTAKVTMHIQLPTPGNLLQNPVTTACGTLCDRPVNEIYWIQKVCVTAGFPGTLADAYSSLYQAMDLCCNNWRGIAIPNCDGLLGSCLPGGSPTAYTVVINFPRCVLNTGPDWQCYEACQNCTNYCAIERRYCNKLTTPPLRECSSCEVARCPVGAGAACGEPCLPGTQPLNCGMIRNYGNVCCQ